MRRSCNLELRLFPVYDSDHHHPIEEEGSEISPQQKCHQQQQEQKQQKLTIFYDGKICVRDVTEFQVFDEKQGIVTIKVVCWDPEKLRDKLCCKGGGSIKSIEIVQPPKPKPKPDPTPSPVPQPPPSPPGVLVVVCWGPCYQGCGCCDRYYGWPVCDSNGGGRPCYVSRCDRDENPQGCTVM